MLEGKSVRRLDIGRVERKVGIEAEQLPDRQPNVGNYTTALLLRGIARRGLFILERQLAVRLTAIKPLQVDQIEKARGQVGANVRHAPAGIHEDSAGEKTCADASGHLLQPPLLSVAEIGR